MHTNICKSISRNRDQSGWAQLWGEHYKRVPRCIITITRCNRLHTMKNQTGSVVNKALEDTPQYAATAKAKMMGWCKNDKHCTALVILSLSCSSHCYNQDAALPNQPIIHNWIYHGTFTRNWWSVMYHTSHRQQGTNRLFSCSQAFMQKSRCEVLGS